MEIKIKNEIDRKQPASIAVALDEVRLKRAKQKPNIKIYIQRVCGMK